MSQFGIQMYTLRDSMKTPEDYENTLRRVAEMGYTNVQITPPDFAGVEGTQKLLEKYGLKADSAMCWLGEIPHSIEKIKKNAEILGTDVLRTGSIDAEDRNDLEGYKRAAEMLEKCGKLLYNAGLKFMYHFHSFEFIKLGDTRGIDILLGETDPKHVYFQPDVFWLASSGTEPSRSLEMFRGRAIYMHLKDYIIARRESAVLEETKAASAPVGTGNLDWKHIIETAKNIGIQNFVVEDDMGVLDPFESAKISIQNMKKLGF